MVEVYIKNKCSTITVEELNLLKSLDDLEYKIVEDYKCHDYICICKINVDELILDIKDLNRIEIIIRRSNINNITLHNSELYNLFIECSTIKNIKSDNLRELNVTKSLITNINVKNLYRFEFGLISTLENDPTFDTVHIINSPNNITIKEAKDELTIHNAKNVKVLKVADLHLKIMNIESIEIDFVGQIVDASILCNLLLLGINNLLYLNDLVDIEENETTSNHKTLDSYEFDYSSINLDKYRLKEIITSYRNRIKSARK